MTFTLTTTTSSLLLRPTVAGDIAPLLEWCHTLWNGERDYIEDTLPDWIAAGNLFTGVLAADPAPVALLRLRQLSPAEAWFGGLRLHPQLQGQGLGRAILEWIVAWARTQGASRLGYMTEIRNARMHHLGALLGFSDFGTFHVWEPPAAASVAALELIEPATLPPADPLIATQQHGRYIHDWTLLELNPARLETHRQRSELLATRDLTGWMILEGLDQPDIYLEQLGGDPTHFPGLLAAAMARTRPDQRLASFPWDGSAAAAALADQGWQQSSDHYRLFERPL